ncbi:hypothetical protein CAPTEDRAFT_217201 [Capitella teleta]|uniref:Uncharacterized protein n=1 Tax=Capitella teleta TaxID=283909 RepID=R7VAS6_CAPTE|nr:hypothetical protein CAPTEDRAFT_217201 [Capitella teleta]|eukprot:ELU15684.1 hypothetical protein CAPTEDRAFT_217201 [Capitella teleta]
MTDRERLLKVTFANSFDARSFLARHDERRKTGADNDALMKLHMRSGRSKEEQVRYKRLKADTHKLNLDAKKDGLQCYRKDREETQPNVRGGRILYGTDNRLPSILYGIDNRLPSILYGIDNRLPSILYGIDNRLPSIRRPDLECRR